MRFLTDEHVPPALVRGLKRSLPGTDILELRHTDLLGATDPDVLEFAASQSRILITRDISTVPDFAFERVLEGKAMPGVFIWRRKVSLGDVLADLVLIVQASEADEWTNRVVYLHFS